MKKKVISYICLMIIAGSQADLAGAASRQEHYPNGQLRSESTFQRGRMLTYTEYYQNGQVKIEQVFEDGKKHGQWKEYYKDGSLKSQESYDQGRPVGIWRFYDKRGRVRKEVDYQREEKHRKPKK